MNCLGPRRFLPLILLSAYLLSAPGRAAAQITLTWNGNVSTTWDSVTNNWSGGATTFTNGLSDVNFGNGASQFNVAVQAGGVSPRSILLNNDAAHTYTFSGGAISLSNGQFALQNGSLSLVKGGVINAKFTPQFFLGLTLETRIGIGSGMTGAVNVSGVGSQLTSGHLGIGGDLEGGGAGLLNVRDGRTVVSNYTLVNNGSRVLVSDPGSTWTTTGELFVAPSLTGHLTVQNGGTVRASRIYFAGRQIGMIDNLPYGGAHGTGSITVTGVGSRLIADLSIEFGRYGTESGTIGIYGGGKTISNFVSGGPRSNLIISGSGSQLSTTSSIASRGRVDVLDGGTLTTGEQFTAWGGDITVSGNGSSLSATT